MNSQEIIKLIVSIGLCQSAGIIGSVFTASAIPTWYASLSKPSFGPPNWLFGPVWITLYTLMGISLYLVWKQGLGSGDVRLAMAVFGVHLILNALWSILFFGLKNPFIAFIEIVALLIMIIASMVLFYGVSKPAAFLLVPYLAWVSFATVLNFAIWRLNL
jgi:tryptophan-rich sensory protein